jgi:hypothetical protein
MTQYECYSLIISVAGFAAVIVSLVFLIRQTREMTKQSRSIAVSLKDNAFESMKSLVIKIDEIFLEYPELRPYFYGGKVFKETDEVLFHKVSTVAETILDIFLSIIQRRKNFSNIWYIWPQEELDNYFRFVFANSPFLCNYLEGKHDWYIKEMIILMKEGKSLHMDGTTNRNKQH